MKIYTFLVIVSFTVLGFNTVTAQNFFPLSAGNKYQFYRDRVNTCISWGFREYLATEISDSLVYYGEVYYKYDTFKGPCYFSCDTTEQKLFIYDEYYHKKLAADFNLQNGQQFTSYLTGSGLIFTSAGRSFINVFGEDRLAWIMYYYDQVSDDWEYYTFIDGIGFYKDYWWEYCGILVQLNLDEIYYASAIINDQVYNPVVISLNLSTPLNNRKIAEFPFSVEISLNMSAPEFLDSLYLQYQVTRDGNEILYQQVPFNLNTYQALVNLNSTILSVGDSINLRITASDTSIFNNHVTLPDTGYYTIIVLPDSATSIKRQEVNSKKFLLKQNYPNPFNPVTTLEFVLGKFSFVSLKVYDILGNEVAELVNEEKLAGVYSIKFDAGILPSGVYYYQMRAGNYSATKKLILLK